MVKEDFCWKMANNSRGFQRWLAGLIWPPKLRHTRISSDTALAGPIPSLRISSTLPTFSHNRLNNETIQHF